MLGAFVALFFMSSFAAPAALAAVAAFALTGVFGIFLDRVAFAPLRRRGAPPLSAMISSLGFAIVVIRLMELRYGPDLTSYPAGSLPQAVVQIGDARLDGLRLLIIGLAILLMAALTYVVRKTQLGRDIRALAENPRAARLLGVDVDRAIAATFFISSGLGGVAGALLGFAYNAIYPQMGTPYELKAFTVMVVGWMGSLPGAALGALASAVLALPLGLAVFRLRGVYLAIATIGFGEVVRVVLLTLPFTGKALGLNGIPPITELWHIYLSLAVIAYVLWRAQGSTVGRAWAAIREDEIAAASQGIAVRRYKLAAFVVGAAVAAWAGGLSAHLNFSIEPGDFGFTRAVQILVYAVVGGTPSVAGPILGATLLTALPEILRPLKEYRDIFAGLILMGVIIYLPRGLVTLAELRKTRRLREIGAADVA